jgi:hypothetical protein
MTYEPLRPFTVRLDTGSEVLRLTARDRRIANAARAAQPGDLIAFVHNLTDRLFLAERPVDPFAIWPVVLTYDLDPGRIYFEEDRPLQGPATISAETADAFVEACRP